MSHNFRRNRNSPKDPTQDIWRCEKCDSEVSYPKFRTDQEVNQMVVAKWPKFVCISPDFFTKPPN